MKPCPVCQELMLLPVRTPDGALKRWCTWCDVRDYQRLKAEPKPPAVRP